MIVRCKHYPFTCEEVDQQQSEIFQEIYGSHGRYEKYGTCCDFFGKCFCDEEHTPAKRHFFQFKSDKELMDHFDNCYDDCCTMCRLFERFFITIKIKIHRK